MQRLAASLIYAEANDKGFANFQGLMYRLQTNQHTERLHGVKEIVMRVVLDDVF